MADLTIKDALQSRNLLQGITLPALIDELLTDLTACDDPDKPPPVTPSTPTIGSGDDVQGFVILKVQHNLGSFALNLDPPATPLKYQLTVDSTAKSFQFWLVLSSLKPVAKIFSFAAGAAGVVLKAATRVVNGDEETLVADPANDPVTINGLAVALLIAGNQGEEATLRMTPTVGEPPGIIELSLQPPTVLIGSTGFGLELPVGSDGKRTTFVIDDSSTAAPPGSTVLNGTAITTKADDPAWRGLAVRQARFYVPSGAPLLGGHAVDAYVEVGTQAGEGIDLIISTQIPPKDSRPGIDVTIECRDPAAVGLQDFIPTLVELAMELPLNGMHQDSPGGGFDLLAGKPVIARLRFARSVADPDTTITLSIESQGDDGVLTVVAPDGGAAARVIITTAALATAIVADKGVAPGADGSGVVLHELLVAAVGLSSFFKNQGSFTIHKAEIQSTGHGLPVGEKVKLLIDYSVDVLVQPIDVGVLSVQMSDAQPMRVRNRNVGLTLNLSNPGLHAVELDFHSADMEIEDPGGWIVNSPGSIFDILGTRSGRGSTWLEVDLRFKLNLGPVRVSGATIRATLEDNGSVSASLRGLDVSLVIPGVIDGSGSLQLLDGGGFSAALTVDIDPLGLNVDGTVLYKETEGSYWLFVQIGVDLPGPIPIANTGLGIYGIAAAFAVNARPMPPSPTEKDPIGYQLNWSPTPPDKEFEFEADELTFGAQAVFGTVPDFGFSFSGRAGIFLSVPDIVVRGSLWGQILSPRMGVTDPVPSGDGAGVSFRGVVVVDPSDGVTIGLNGQLTVPVLLLVTIPLGAHFPTTGDTSNWYIYLGTDGYANNVPSDGRALGPVRAQILPDLLDAEADAYLMFRGHGIQKWPRGGSISISDGFVIAFGFGFDYSIGVKPIAWADVHASADILLAAHPLTLAGFGSVGGSLNLGPFSIGVDATLSLLAVENEDPYIDMQLCGHIDLFFTEIQGCVELCINSEPTLSVPVPTVHPLDNVQSGAKNGQQASLIDDQYRLIAPLATQPDEVGSMTPVWADTLIHLVFNVSPSLAANYVTLIPATMTPQFAGIDQYPTGEAAQVSGNDMLHYQWSLTGLALYDITADVHGPGTLVNIPMSAAWQAGKDGDPGKRPQAAELILLTYQGDLYLQRVAAGAGSSPDSPINNAATACQREVRPLAGWAVGFDSALAGAAFVLPADPITPDPCVSRFTVTLTQQASVLPGVSLAMNTASQLAPPYDFNAAYLEEFNPPLNLERAFAGALDLAVVKGGAPLGALLKRVWQTQTARLVPEQPLTESRLWLIIDGSLEAGIPLLVTVVDDAGNSWINSNNSTLADGRTALRFAPSSAGWVSAIDITWRLGARMAILGLGGITATAEAAAAARNAAQQAESDRQAKAAAAQPQPAGVVSGPDAHTILDPGHTYRLDVSMTWEGWLYTQDENGNKKQVDHKLSTSDPTQASFTNRQYFFRTTPQPTPTNIPITTALSVYGKPSSTPLIRLRRDMFDPVMLTRFLLGYTPEQTEMARFCDDPVNAHFSAAHVIALAAAYGYTVLLGLRRVDVAGTDGDPVELNTSWLTLKEPSLLSGTDKLRFNVAATAPCAIPKPGGTLEAQPPAPLAPFAWYEVYVLAKSNLKNVADGTLEGVTFRTSLWGNPAAMLAGIGFTGTPGTATGDIEIKQLPPMGPAIIDGSDADYEAALNAIGLQGWPLTQSPRISLIWLVEEAADGPSWKFAGLLLESPEPVARPNRVTLNALRLVMQPLPGGVFDIRRSDRQQSRILWLCSTPFAPHTWMHRVLFLPPRRVSPTIALDITDVATGALLSGSISLPLAPSFAKEA